MIKLVGLAILFSFSAAAQNDTTKPLVQENKKEKKWYDNISIRGYMQVRYNRLLETNQDLKCEQCDRSWGENGGIFLRRMRVILYGQIHEQVYFYIQPDYPARRSHNPVL